MAEYIERKKLLNELQEEIDFETTMYTKEQNEYFNMGLKCAVRDVKRQPTADVVEVVRCGQCGNYCKNTGECNLYGRHPNENDFCSNGVLKELGK